MAIATPAPPPDGHGHDILPHRRPAVPLGSRPGLGPRLAVRPALGAADRGGAGPRAADRDLLDPGGWAVERVPAGEESVAGRHDRFRHLKPDAHQPAV